MSDFSPECGCGVCNLEMRNEKADNLSLNTSMYRRREPNGNYRDRGYDWDNSVID